MTVLTAPHVLLAGLLGALCLIGFLTAALWSARRKLRIATARLDRAETARSRMGKKVVDAYGSLDGLTAALRFSKGGVGRRILECRQIATTIKLHAPVLFEIDKNLLHNLALMDEFLVDLHQRYQATVDGDAHQMRIAGAMGAEIYMEIHRDSGMQPSRLQVRAV